MTVGTALVEEAEESPVEETLYTLDAVLSGEAGEIPGDRDALMALLEDPDEVWTVEWCSDCNEWSDDTVEVSGDSVCRECLDEGSDYFYCDRCEVYYRGWDYAEVGDLAYCPDCRDECLLLCGGCDEYYRRDGRCCGDRSTYCCTSPRQDFSIALGAGVGGAATGSRLESGQTQQVKINEGEISDEGLSAIDRLLQAELVAEGEEALRYWEKIGYQAATRVCQVGREWKNAKGTYPKRLRSAVYKNLDVKIPDALLSKIGDLARDHSTGIDVEVQITRDLNRTAEEFGNDESCWWDLAADYSYSRCTLKSNGGFGLIVPGRYGICEGRAWVLPLAEDEAGALVPTFGEAAAYVVFNAYGDLEERRGVRVMAALTGWSWKSVPLSRDRWEMYINGEDDGENNRVGGYLVAPDGVLDDFANALPTYLQQHPAHVHGL